MIAGDFYAFLKENDTPLTNMRLFYNTNRQSARINIPSEFDDVVSCDECWPDDMVVRKWKNRTDYLEDRDEEAYKRFPRGRGRRRNWNNDPHYENNGPWSDFDKRYGEEWEGGDCRRGAFCA